MKEDTKFSLLMIATGVALAGVVALAVIQDRYEWSTAYLAFIKQTGNPNGLTFEEWRALTKAGRPQTVNIPVVIPIPTR